MRQIHLSEMKLTCMCVIQVMYCIVRSSHSFSQQQLEDCIEAAELVFMSVDRILTKCSKNEKTAARLSITLMLHLMSKLDSAKLPEVARMKEGSKLLISTLLKRWIGRSGVIGMFMFGGGSTVGRYAAEATVCVYSQ